MRCFFNLVNGHDFLLDTEGVDIKEPGLLKDEAERAVVENLRENPLQEIDGWRMEVTDASGAILVVIPFDSVRV